MAMTLHSTPARSAPAPVPSTPAKRICRPSSDRSAPRSHRPHIEPLRYSTPSTASSQIAFPSWRSSPNAPPSPSADDLDFSYFSHRRSSTSSISSVDSDTPSLASSCSSQSSSTSEGAHLMPSLAGPSSVTAVCDPTLGLGHASRAMTTFTMMAFNESNAGRPRSIVPPLPKRPSGGKRISSRSFDELMADSSPRWATPDELEQDSVSSFKAALSRPSKRRSICQTPEVLARALA